MNARHHASQHVRHLAQLEIRLARTRNNISNKVIKAAALGLAALRLL